MIQAITMTQDNIDRQYIVIYMIVMNYTVTVCDYM